MFDIGFTELIVIGIVALVVVGPERLPKVARAAGHLYGRMQRYVSTVRSDISREMQLDEMRRVGQDFKQSVESAASGVEQQASVVDDYLRGEVDMLDKSVRNEPQNAQTPPQTADAEPAQPDVRQQTLPLEEPDQNRAAGEPSSTSTRPA
ncbi:twin-arginine translocation protein TatB [Thiobacillus denitrificans ATCC 25259]|uniref:Sec-independent protein translocase protein TatB n=1 Tax=Thiobacillus denitrificans (strain ATCC 25259 / T1) TaxID=292415 RepID=TATB_THIDA|nr:Sec-independent protein translocase protein TatB [Thiobacillus denitrificans]Q3SI72.1 RecName: Full=Sec-independent protein translocase protein TatB [Thiobacillus denitrificans ATCC 25259]AAZ97656.1 twin-arginine translocation protein TatB [Thiobacillus denitrificans ATCC 25259]